MVNLEFLKSKNAAFSQFEIKDGDFLSENDAVLRTKTGIIYLIVNLVNGKVYVGQSVGSFSFRYKNKWWINTDSDHLKNAATKYGYENFRIFILEDGRGRNILNILETYYILTFKSNQDEFGYNKTMAERSRIKIQMSNKEINKIFNSLTEAEVFLRTCGGLNFKHPVLSKQITRKGKEFNYHGFSIKVL